MDEVMIQQEKQELSVETVFSSLENFKEIYDIGKMFATSSLIPASYQGKPMDCTIAVEMANRMGVSPMMVMQNLYGDILSDLCSGLIGGLGLVPSSNIGADYAMFEAVHGSAPDIAGKHLANPTAFLWSACMMLEYLGENETAARIRKAVDEVLAEGKHLTKDLHGTASTEEYVDAILERL